MDAIFMQATLETEASILEDGFLAITQITFEGEKKEIFLSKEQAQTVYNYLRDTHYVI